MAPSVTIRILAQPTISAYLVLAWVVLWIPTEMAFRMCATIVDWFGILRKPRVCMAKKAMPVPRRFVLIKKPMESMPCVFTTAARNPAARRLANDLGFGLFMSRNVPMLEVPKTNDWVVERFVAMTLAVPIVHEIHRVDGHAVNVSHIIPAVMVLKR